MVFQTVPPALEFFHFKDEEDLKTSKWLRLHATLNWRMIGRIVKAIDNPQPVLNELHSVAKAHTAFSLNQEVFNIVGGLFLTVLEEGLGPTVWNDELKEAWKETFDLIAKEMLKGIEENKATVLEGETPEAKMQQLVAEDWKVANPAILLLCYAMFGTDIVYTARSSSQICMGMGRSLYVSSLRPHRKSSNFFLGSRTHLRQTCQTIER